MHNNFHRSVTSYLAISRTGPCTIYIHSESQLNFHTVLLSLLYALQVRIQKPKGPHFNALQNWKAKFVTPFHCFSSLPFVFCCLTLYFQSLWYPSVSGEQLFLFLLSKRFWAILLAFFLCHSFVLYNAISCYLRAAVENMYFNLHSWHISSAT